MNHTRKVAENRQQDVDPELKSESDLQEYAERRNKNRQDDANNVHAHTNAKISIPDGNELGNGTLTQFKQASSLNPTGMPNQALLND